ncbi:MAG: cysteine desulfurase [Candidatus Xenolissoclinum pacificiensis L6]|uniref:Cysteine desulfurase n=1 Tax=Candidatus Xenolissoclinum pacificiensis L6 TaxID=1401685 RepID=W2V196_9RICK|nr:MAG: cysteine desulfurase [Candidatus Xenolissoclinum pacificiensis L6]
MRGDQLVENKIYFDNAATTHLDPEVLEVMKFVYSYPSNMHSRNHAYGWRAENIVEDARSKIASYISAQPKEIIFTSGATESNNLAIRGLAKFFPEKKHIITVQTEHKAVLDVLRDLESSSGYSVTYLKVNEKGFIDIDELERSIRSDTLLISVMAVNNEIGIIQDLVSVGALCRKHDVFFHSDAAQAFGKIDLDVEKMNIDLLSISGHKIYGPMGIGALYIRKTSRRVRLKPIFFGGGQERATRSGTVPTALVAGLGRATELIFENGQSERDRIKNMRDSLYKNIKKGLPYVILNGDLNSMVCGILNLSFPYVEGESIMMALKDIALSSGSACTSASLEPSYVLKAIGRDDIVAHSSVRFSIGRFNNMDEVNTVSDLVINKIQRLLDMSPLWDMVQKGIDPNKVEWIED